VIRLTVNGKAITATLIDSETARDFISLLPLTLTMNDLCRREKFANLPRTLSNEGRHKRTYAVGEIAYWPPGPDVASFTATTTRASQTQVSSPSAKYDPASKLLTFADL
jgi:hypothetical protein